MADILEIKLKFRNGGSVIIDIKDVESLYFGEVLEYISYKDGIYRRSKKAKQVGICLRESADKLGRGKLSVFERLMNEQSIYSIELLYQDEVEEIFVPYESGNVLCPNRCQQNEIHKGMKLTFNML
jgi:hypothetical protein